MLLTLNHLTPVCKALLSRRGAKPSAFDHDQFHGNGSVDASDDDVLDVARPRWTRHDDDVRGHGISRQRGERLGQRRDDSAHRHDAAEHRGEKADGSPADRVAALDHAAGRGDGGVGERQPEIRRRTRFLGRRLGRQAKVTKRRGSGQGLRLFRDDRRTALVPPDDRFERAGNAGLVADPLDGAAEGLGTAAKRTNGIGAVELRADHGWHPARERTGEGMSVVHWRRLDEATPQSGQERQSVAGLQPAHNSPACQRSVNDFAAGVRAARP